MSWLYEHFILSVIFIFGSVFIYIFICSAFKKVPNTIGFIIITVIAILLKYWYLDKF